MTDIDNGQVTATLAEVQTTTTDVQTTVWEEFSSAELLRAHIFNTPDIQEEVVEVPEWRVRVLVRGMNGKERARVLQGAINVDGTPNLEKAYPDMIIATCFHIADRKYVFSPGDRDSLNLKAGGILEKLAMVASRLSGLDKTDTLKKS